MQDYSQLERFGVHYCHPTPIFWIRIGAWDHAEAQLSDALEWSVESNNRLMEASISQKLGEVYLALNRYSDSERYLLRSLKLISGSGSIVGELALVPSLCELYRRTSRHTKAKETLIQAQKTMGEAADWGALHGDLRLEEALVSAALGSWEDGEEFFQTAVQAYREFDLPWDKARAYYEWGPCVDGRRARWISWRPSTYSPGTSAGAMGTHGSIQIRRTVPSHPS